MRSGGHVQSPPAHQFDARLPECNWHNSKKQRHKSRAQKLRHKTKGITHQMGIESSITDINNAMS